MMPSHSQGQFTGKAIINKKLPFGSFYCSITTSHKNVVEGVCKYDNGTSTFPFETTGTPI